MTLIKVISIIELEVRIPDSPGALIKLIEPISENSGNIHGIVHSHKDSINGNIPVLIRFEFLTEEKKANLEKIKKRLQNLNFQIMKITDTPAAHHMTVILSGHVFRQDFEETVRRINNIGVKVRDVEAKITTPDDISNVRINIEIPDEIDDIVVFNELEAICEEKKLMMLREEIF